MRQFSDEVPWALPEVIEAAVRTQNPLLAGKALERLPTAGAATSTDWGLGVATRSRALMTGDARQAEDLYLEAIGTLGRATIATDLARAHLVYGEWLRRERRRGDAREQLRTAHAMFASMGARPSPTAPPASYGPPASTRGNGPPRPRRGSLPSKPRSPSLPARDCPTPRSPRSCSSAAAPSNTTCRTSSPNSASPPAPSSRSPATGRNLNRPHQTEDTNAVRFRRSPRRRPR